MSFASSQQILMEPLNRAGVLEENLALQNCRQKYKMKLEHDEEKVEMLKMIFLRNLGKCKSFLVFFKKELTIIFYLFCEIPLTFEKQKLGVEGELVLLAAIISVLSSELIVKFKARESVKVKRIIYESGTFVK